VTERGTTVSAAPNSVRTHLPAITVWGATVGYAVIAAYFSLRRHDAFLTGYDLANFDQELWLLAHGHQPLNTQTGRLFWGEHFSLTIALLTPLYVLGGGAKALLSLQALTMVAVAPLLYALARAYGARPWLATLPALLWLASPLTLLANLFDVHHVPLVVPLIVGSILALRYDRLALFVALGLLACFAKEDVPLMYSMLGIVVALEGRRKLGAAISAVSFGIFVFAVAVYMPAFGDSASWFAKRFAGARGTTVVDVFVWMASHPLAAADQVFTAQNVTDCLVLILMTGGLCLLAPRWMLLGAPALLHNVLSAYPPQNDLTTHYFVPVAVSFAIAAAVGVRRLAEISQRKRLLVAACTATAFFSFFIGVSSARTSSDLSAAPHANAGGVAARLRAISLVPDDAVVAATPRLSAHLSEREEIYALPLPFLGREAYGTDWSAEEMARRAKRVRWVVIDTDDRPIEFPLVAERILPLLPELGFHAVFREGSVIVFSREGERFAP